MKKGKLGSVLFYLSALIMTFAVFMFFIVALKWVDKSLAEELKKIISQPSLFDLIFGTTANESATWPMLFGSVVLFFIQIALSIACLTLLIMVLTKKVYIERAVYYLLGFSFVAIICGGLSLLTKIFINDKFVFIQFVDVTYFKVSLKDALSLSYGPIIYSTTMFAASLCGITSFIVYKIKN